MIERSGPTPPFGAYITENALIPMLRAPSVELLALAEGKLQWVDVPSFQRGIEWYLEDVLELAGSSSSLLGSVILGQFSKKEGQFSFLPNQVNHYCVLVDGLQRFSVGTALLSVLYDLVMRSEPQYPHLASQFANIKAQYISRAPIFLHNDHELQYHGREAVAQSYVRLRAELHTHMKDILDSGRVDGLAKDLTRLFLKRQVAVDLYFNFPSTMELTHTFIGLNTVRVDLNPIDLVRSYIVDRGLSAKWPAADIDDIENAITKTFCVQEDGEPKKLLAPFVGVLEELLGEGDNQAHVFPSWRLEFPKAEVARLLTFVQTFERQIEANPYVRETAAIGTIPIAGLIAHYYRRHLSDGAVPPFFDGKTEDDESLHRYLVANFRSLLEGHIGRSRPFARKIFSGIYPTLGDASEALSFEATGYSLKDDLPIDLLRSRLRLMDRKKAQRAFNAVRLPERVKQWGARFKPDVYGTKAKQLNVDHLIPKSLKVKDAPGSLEIETLVNFAPMLSSQNTDAKATYCSRKLEAGGIYDRYLTNEDEPHPYCRWLRDAQGAMGSALDLPSNLEVNKQAAVGDMRIQWLAQTLQKRV